MGQAIPQVHTDTLLLADGTRILVGSAGWFEWLARASSFSYCSPQGTFTARKERFQRGGWYWKAYRKASGKLRSAYLGLPGHLTTSRLEEVAWALARPAAAARTAQRNPGDPLPATAALAPPAPSGVPGAAPAAAPGGDDSPARAFPRTKLLVPPVRGMLVPREQLFERLESASRLPLTVLAAPAGYGKTTLLSSWVAARRPRCAWVSIERTDNDLIRFWNCVCAAIAEAVPGAAALARVPGLARPSAPAREVVLPLIDALADALCECQRPLILVLDDYHLIEVEAIHESVAYLLDHLPPTLSLVIAGRADPPLPLARWRAHGQLAEIGATDLSFSGEEVAAFCQRVLGVRPAAEAVGALATRTEGWAAGVQLALLALRGVPDVAAGIQRLAQRPTPAVSAFFIEEIVTQQPAEIQAFLLATAVLDRFRAPLCDAVGAVVGARARSEDLIAQIERANLFLVPLDDERRWFRYHHLFAEALRARLRQTAPQRVLALHRRAAEWFRREGMPLEAIEHALAAHDFALAAQWIGEAASAFERWGETSTLLRWLAALPEPALAADPAVCILYARALATIGEPERAEAVVQLAERRLRAASAAPAHTDAGHLGAIAAIRGENAMARGEFQAGIAQYCLAIDLLPEESAYLRTEVTAGLGTAYLAVGDLAAGLRAYEMARAIATRSGDGAAVLGSSASLGFLHVLQGRLAQARATFDEALHFAGEHESATAPLASMMYLGLGEVVYQWNELAAARRAMEQAMALSRRWGDAMVLVRSHIGLATVMLAEGDPAGARTLLEAIDPERVALPPRIGHLARAASARLALASGEIERAASWARGLALTPDMTVGYPQEYSHLVFARLLIAQAAWTDAERLLARLRVSAEAGGRWGRLIEVLILRALALQGAGSAAMALDDLMRALRLAQPSGYVRLFLDEGRPLQALLQCLLRGPLLGDDEAEHASIAAYGRRLLAADRLTAAPPPLARRNAVHTAHAGPATEPLSPQEAAILPLLAEGRSNRDVARTLVVETSTVKWHLQQIYRKLGVQNRVQAIQAARAQGWIA